jgi:hypothetical protein
MLNFTNSSSAHIRSRQHGLTHGADRAHPCDGSTRLQPYIGLPNGYVQNGSKICMAILSFNITVARYFCRTASVVQWSEFLATDSKVQVQFPDFLKNSGSWKIVDLEQGPLNLVSTIEELLGRKSNGCLKIREYDRRDPPHWRRGTLYPRKFNFAGKQG